MAKVRIDKEYPTPLRYFGQTTVASATIAGAVLLVMYIWDLSGNRVRLTAPIAPDIDSYWSFAQVIVAIVLTAAVTDFLQRERQRAGPQRRNYLELLAIFPRMASTISVATLQVAAMLLYAQYVTVNWNEPTPVAELANIGMVTAVTISVTIIGSLPYAVGSVHRRARLKRTMKELEVEALGRRRMAAAWSVTHFRRPAATLRHPVLCSVGALLALDALALATLLVAPPSTLEGVVFALSGVVAGTVGPVLAGICTTCLRATLGRHLMVIVVGTAVLFGLIVVSYLVAVWGLALGESPSFLRHALVLALLVTIITSTLVTLEYSDSTTRIKILPALATFHINWLGATASAMERRRARLKRHRRLLKAEARMLRSVIEGAEKDIRAKG